jgi:hypothetical protein
MYLGDLGVKGNLGDKGNLVDVAEEVQREGDAGTGSVSASPSVLILSGDIPHRKLMD